MENDSVLFICNDMWDGNRCYCFLAIRSMQQMELQDIEDRKIFESSQSLADDLNEWYKNSLSDTYYRHIPDDTPRSLITNAYPLLDFTLKSGRIPIDCGSIRIGRSK